MSGLECFGIVIFCEFLFFSGVYFGFQSGVKEGFIKSIEILMDENNKNSMNYDKILDSINNDSSENSSGNC